MSDSCSCARLPTSPIACALEGEALENRVRAWAAVGERALVRRGRDGERAVLRYRRERGVEDELRRLVRLEGECCPFLTFGLAPDGTELVLTVSGPAAAGPLVEAFLGAPLAGASPASPPARRGRRRA